MKLVVDMNLSPRWAAFLRDAGHVADHWSAIGSAKASDAEITAHAVGTEAVIVTHDLDFGTILAASGSTAPSVVIIRSDTLAIEAIGQQVLTVLRQFEPELLVGALIAVHPQRTRVRLLPIAQ